MGCRCRPDRSFHFRGRPFPICARCTGILCGFLAAGVGIWLGTPGLIPLLLLMAPMIVDGTIQRLAKRESNNPRRFITGILWGYAAMTLLLLSLVLTYRLGRSLGGRLLQG